MGEVTVTYHNILSLQLLSSRLLFIQQTKH